MNQTQTVGRALDILFVLAAEEDTLTVSQIAEKVPLPESTTYRLIKTLELNGVVERKAKGQISLGMRIMDLAKSLHQQIDRDLLTIARPIMDNLTEKLNESSLLVVRRGTVGITVQHAEGKRLIGLVTKNGSTHPLHRGATGKAILAFENEKIIENVLKMENEENPEAFLKEFEEIRKRKMIKTTGEVESNTLAVAAPIFDKYNRILASLSVVGPKDRFDEETTQQTINAV